LLQQSYHIEVLAEHELVEELQFGIQHLRTEKGRETPNKRSANAGSVAGFAVCPWLYCDYS
jgi:hypothetical protein